MGYRPSAGRGVRRAVQAGLAGLLTCAAPALVTAQTFTGYTAFEGLPQAQVYALHQDRQGFLWIGTYAGLTRFDGREFRTWTRRDGLTSNAVRAVAEDAGGRIIVGTTGGGVCFKEAGGFRCLGTAEGLPSDSVLAILPDGPDATWVATERGVARMAADGSMRVFTQDGGLPGRLATRLARDRFGRLWAATDRGLAWLSADRFVLHPAEELRNTPVTLLLALPDGLVIGTDRTVYRDRGGRLEPVAGLPADARWYTAAAADARGHLWLATRGGAVVAASGAAARYTRADGLLDDIVHAVLVDREQNIWFGTDGGLSRLTLGPFRSFSVDAGLPHPFVRALEADRDGRLWVGTRDGVAVRDGAGFRAVPLPGVPDRRVYALAPLPSGGMLIGTARGLVHHNGTVRRIVQPADGLPHEFVLSLRPDGRGGVWVGTAGGVIRWIDGRLEPVADPVLARVFATSLALDRRGRLWVGRRDDGVLVFDGTATDVLDAARGFSNQTIWAMREDASGAMWVGTNGDGAYRVGPDGAIRRFTTDDGLVNDFVWQVETDTRGGVWFYTNHGLNRYAAGRFQYYGRAHGLVRLEGGAGASWRDAAGDLWFGSGGGLLRYSAALDTPRAVQPLVFVERLEAGGQPLPMSGARVQPGAGILHVTYTSPTFFDVPGVRFRYRLNPGDAWSPLTADRAVSFGALEPGHYAFEVQAVTRDGVVSAASATAAFTVLPWFWQTWWFQTLGLVVFAAVAASIPWVRGRHVRRDRMRLAEVVEARTADLAAQNARLEREIAERAAAEEALLAKEAQLRHAQKMEAVGRLAGGIAHDFNNLLTAISGHTEFALESVPAGAHVAEDLQAIRRAAERAAALVNKLLVFSRQPGGAHRPVDLNVVAAEASRTLERVLGSDVKLDIALAPYAAWMLGDDGQLDQIILNLAINARDAMPDGGRLKIAVSAVHVPEQPGGEVPAGRWVVLEVADTGHGIDPEVRPRLFEPFFTTKEPGRGTGLGLATVYGIVTQNEGHITVDSTPGVGARFRIWFPEIDPPARALPAASAARREPAEPESRVVLVVEDEDSVRRLVCRTLERHGLHVLQARDGAAALDVAQAYPGPIDLLLSDVIMPGLNGRQVADRISLQRPGTRVLFMSGHTEGVLGRHQLAAAAHLLRKPFTPAELTHRVDEALAR